MKKILSSLLLCFLMNAHADVKEAYESGKAIFIDVREESEVKEGMIKGALWIPLSKIEKDPKKEIEALKTQASGKEIFLYCRSGKRSGKVQGYLKETGIKAENAGGYTDLVSKGLPTQAHPVLPTP